MLDVGMEILSRSWEPRSSTGHVFRYDNIITGYKAATDVVTLYIDECAVLDSDVVRAGKSARRARRTEHKFVGHLGGDWLIISYCNRIWTALFFH